MNANTIQRNPHRRAPRIRIIPIPVESILLLVRSTPCVLVFVTVALASLKAVYIEVFQIKPNRNRLIAIIPVMKMGITFT
jgi:hypothetical protein